MDSSRQHTRPHSGLGRRDSQAALVVGLSAADFGSWRGPRGWVSSVDLHSTCVEPAPRLVTGASAKGAGDGAAASTTVATASAVGARSGAAEPGRDEVASAAEGRTGERTETEQQSPRRPRLVSGAGQQTGLEGSARRASARSGHPSGSRSRHGTPVTGTSATMRMQVRGPRGRTGRAASAAATRSSREVVTKAACATGLGRWRTASASAGAGHPGLGRGCAADVETRGHAQPGRPGNGRAAQDGDFGENELVAETRCSEVRHTHGSCSDGLGAHRGRTAVQAPETRPSTT